jgi:protein-S-isoprenylcysteine O-methyltransferase Ste14
MVRSTVGLPHTAVGRARLYFGVQAAAGSLWWVMVFVAEDVREWTLGGWDPMVLVVPDVLFFVVGSAVVAATSNRYAAMVVAGWTLAVTTALVVYGLVERAAGWGVVAMGLATVGTIAASATTWFGRLPLRWFFVGPFAFREAREATTARHLRRSLTQLVVFWTSFFVVMPLISTAVERRLRLVWDPLQPDSRVVAGVVLFAAGSAIGLWSCVTMAVAGAGTPLPAETARELVVSGPYAHVRNPMAVAGVVQTVGAGLWWGSWMVAAAGLAGALIWDLLIRPTEEADLANRFGEPYRRYTQHVRCWLPRKHRTMAE